MSVRVPFQAESGTWSGATVRFRRPGVTVQGLTLDLNIEPACIRLLFYS